MKWLIVEDALRDRKGHWLEYVSTFVRELRTLGDEVVVLCDRKAQGFVMEQTGARPVLPESIWHRMGDGAGAMKRYLRVPGHAWATFVAVRRVFRELFSAQPATSYPIPATSIPPDWIFVPTVLVHHLLGWWMLLKTGSVAKDARMLLFFPNLPIRLDNEGHPHWHGGPTTKLMAWLFASLRGDVESGKLVLGVETHAMRRALEGLIRMPVVYLPHPVDVKPGGEESSEGLVADGSKLVPSSATGNALDAGRSTLDTEASASPIVFGCYGAARWEKGSDIFQEAIQLILKNEVASVGCRVASVKDKAELVTRDPLPATAAGRPLRFAIQWVEDFRDEDGNLVSINPWFLEHPQVEVIGRYFERGEYERRLVTTDVMVLPYRSPYRLRVSRVVIEAMLNGVPVITTRGTTLFEQAQEYGVVIGCEEGDAESLAQAMQEVAQRFKMFRASAEGKRNTAAESFSVGYFRELIK
jgi:glycosyltransferase involved in cell wall biosynthesis